MKILVIGSGAREHAIVWKLVQSKRVSKIYCAPGNVGISTMAECVPINSEDNIRMVEFAVSHQIDLTIVGPEAPLVLGIVDLFQHKGLKIFGPPKASAILEGSKVFAKQFMQKHNIPTAHYRTFTNIDEALVEISEFSLPLVVKADGLAAGKGVIICQTTEEAKTALLEIMRDKKFGQAGSQVVVEEFLCGTEASLLCFVSKNKLFPMVSARDYKKAQNNDLGLNTGGMGSFSPNTALTDELMEKINTQIIANIEKGFKLESMNFCGVLFIGLMIHNEQAKVLEFNVRFGDPETQVILTRLESDLCEIIEKSIDGKLQAQDLQWATNHSLCVILASGGYPQEYTKGHEITGINNCTKDVLIFHGGTKLVNNKIVTDGGRVLAITTIAENIEKAREKIYSSIEKINFRNMQYRTDIGK